MKYHRFFVVIILFIEFISACSTKNKGLANQGYHNMTSKYNVLYNGQVSLNQGIAEMNKKYEDDFSQILPIEPLILTQPLNLETDSLSYPKGSFSIAEEKAVKTVQQHSMYIRGKEYNQQMDRAYLLLGKARYYEKRFIPALESFNYLLSEYPETKLKNQALIWKGKTLIRLENETQGINTLQTINNQSKISSKVTEQVNTTIAMGYLSLDDYSNAIKYLNLATKTHKEPKQYARNKFITAQIFEKSNQIDSAIVNYNNVIDFKKSPERLKVEALLKLVEHDKKTKHQLRYKKALKKMLRNYLYMPYYDKVYYGLAILGSKQDTLSSLNLLSQSTNTKYINPNQQIKTYQQLGDYYFNKSDYLTASAYYDSITPFIKNKKDKDTRSVLRKQESLKEITLLETTIKNNDSILNLIKLDQKTRITVISKHIEQLKESENSTSEHKKTKDSNKSSSAKNKVAKGTWYFYSPQAISYGLTQFKSTWGNRELVDNWRLTKASNFNTNQDLEKEQITNTNNKSNNISNITKYDIETYLKQLKGYESKTDVLKQEISDANYKLGLIYNERFKAYKLSENKLTRFINENPQDNRVLSAKYQLIKLCEQLENIPKANQLKSEIINQHPQSRFAYLLQHKTDKLSEVSKTNSEKHYESLYRAYQKHEYDYVISECKRVSETYQHQVISAKFELLKAYCIKECYGDDDFKKELETLKKNFPNTEESKHAQKLLDKIK